MSHVEIVEIPEIPFGPQHIPPREADASYYREAARNIRYQAGLGRAFSGSNVTEAVAKLCEAVADALEKPAMQVFDPKEWRACTGRIDCPGTDRHYANCASQPSDSPEVSNV